MGQVPQVPKLCQVLFGSVHSVQHPLVGRGPDRGFQADEGLRRLLRPRAVQRGSSQGPAGGVEAVPKCHVPGGCGALVDLGKVWQSGKQHGDFTGHYGCSDMFRPGEDHSDDGGWYAGENGTQIGIASNSWPSGVTFKYDSTLRKDEQMGPTPGLNSFPL